MVATGDGGWVGHNTDGAGMVASFREVIDPNGIEVLIVGAGGAAFAIAVELALAGAATIHVAGRSPDRAAALARLVETGTEARASTMPLTEPLAVPDGAGLVINATPVGMTPEVDAAITVDWATAGPDTVVGDVVFNPATTTFLRAAADAGATTVDGTGMLVNQAAENVRLWTGILPDRAPLRAALEQALGLG